MVIDKVHGLQATSISLNDRFTVLATAEPDRIPARQKRRTAINNFISQNVNFKNQALIEQIARRLEQQARRHTIRQRLGVGQNALRRFNSESHLGIQRSNSFGNLNQGRSVKSRIGWKQSNGNLSRSVSFGNLPGGAGGGRPLRGFRKRGGGQRVPKFRFRGGRQGVARMNRVPLRPRPGGLPARGHVVWGQPARGHVVWGQPARGHSARGRGRGGTQRKQGPKTMLTKEELDAQLEQYMAGTKAALDKELDAYMKNAPEIH